MALSNQKIRFWSQKQSPSPKKMQDKAIKRQIAQVITVPTQKLVTKLLFVHTAVDST